MRMQIETEEFTKTGLIIPGVKETTIEVKGEGPRKAVTVKTTILNAEFSAPISIDSICFTRGDILLLEQIISLLTK
mgnify:CR=1 FL=1